MASNTYETIFVAEPEIAADQLDQFVTKIKQAVTTHQGTIVQEDRWGRRRLAYPIRGHREGFYTFIVFNADPGVIAALDHLYHVTDSVFRHLTIRHIPRKKLPPPRRQRPASAEGHRHSPHAGAPSRGRGEAGQAATRPPSSTESETANSAAAPAQESAASAPAVDSGENKPS